MRKTLAVLACTAMMALPTAAIAGTSADSAGAEIGGNYGTSTCYVTLDYFRVDVAIQSTYPYVLVTKQGSVGGEVHCPLNNI